MIRALFGLAYAMVWDKCNRCSGVSISVVEIAGEEKESSSKLDQDGYGGSWICCYSHGSC